MMIWSRTLLFSAQYHWPIKNPIRVLRVYYYYLYKRLCQIQQLTLNKSLFVVSCENRIHFCSISVSFDLHYGNVVLCNTLITGKRPQASVHNMPYISSACDLNSLALYTWLPVSASSWLRAVYKMSSLDYMFNSKGRKKDICSYIILFAI